MKFRATSPASLPVCASTRARPTPARTSATCGAARARCWPRPPSRTRRASGWQQVHFAAPVAIAANTTYVASYHTDVGHYAADGAYFATAGIDSLAAPRSGQPGRGGNGVYVYGAERVSDADLQRDQLLGRRGVQHEPAGHDAADGDERRAGQRRDRRRHGDERDGDLQRSDERVDDHHQYVRACAIRATGLSAARSAYNASTNVGHADAHAAARPRPPPTRRRSRGARRGVKDLAGNALASNCHLVVHDRRRVGVPLHDLARVGRPRPRSRPTTRARSSSACGSAPIPAARSRACASTRARPTPARTSATCGPTPARCWRRRPSPARPPRAGSRSLRRPGRDHRQHHLRRLVSHQHGQLRRQLAATSRQRAWTTRRSTRWRPASTAPTACIAYGASAFPTQTFNATNYWVDVVFDAERAGHDAADGDERRAGQRRHRRRYGDERDGDLQRGDERVDDHRQHVRAARSEQRDVSAARSATTRARTSPR